MQRIHVIDSHTGGEPTRLVIDGFPDLGTGTMAERRALLAERHDAWRAATVLEPRGSDVLVGALLLTAVVFVMGMVNTFFTPERTRAWLAGRTHGVANGLDAVLDARHCVGHGWAQVFDIQLEIA